MSTIKETDYEPVEVLAPIGAALEAQTRGEIDIQISTAKRYPRSIKEFVRGATEMATLDQETAARCFYALPRDGKTIEGPSARLAEIVAAAWGHMRVEARILETDDHFVTARGMAWDLQSNVAFAFESKRRITNNQGKRFTDDMIGVTSNAAASIAIRNAVFKVVPSALWRQIYEHCRKVAVGDARSLVDTRARLVESFGKMGIVVERLLALLGVAGIEDVSLEHIATLRGLYTAIKDGDTTIDEAFPPAAGQHSIEQMLEDFEPEIRAQVVTAFDLYGLSPAERRMKLRQYRGQPSQLIADLARERESKPVAGANGAAKRAASKPVEPTVAESKADAVAPEPSNADLDAELVARESAKPEPVASTKPNVVVGFNPPTATQQAPTLRRHTQQVPPDVVLF